MTRLPELYAQLTEEDIHISIAGYLKTVLDDRVTWTTVENSNQQGGRLGMIKQAKLKRKGVKAGWPDLQLLWKDDGLKMMTIEVKSAKGRLQDNQKEIHRRLNDMTVSTVVCRSIKEVEAALNTHGVPHLKTKVM